VQKPENLANTLAHHDAEIRTLGGRMSGVESGLKTLQGEVHRGFGDLSSKLDKLDARPTINLHQAVSTVVGLAVLFSMVVGGIIWVTSSQFSGVIAEQKGVNAATNARMERHEALLDKLAERLGWTARVEQPKGAR